MFPNLRVDFQTGLHQLYDYQIIHLKTKCCCSLNLLPDVKKYVKQKSENMPQTFRSSKFLFPPSIRSLARPALSLQNFSSSGKQLKKEIKWDFCDMLRRFHEHSKLWYLIAPYLSVLFAVNLCNIGVFPVVFFGFDQTRHDEKPQKRWRSARKQGLQLHLEWEMVTWTDYCTTRCKPSCDWCSWQTCMLILVNTLLSIFD